MTGAWRLAIFVVVGLVLPLGAAALICAPFGIDGTGWIAISWCLVIGCALMQNRILNKAEAVWRPLRGLPAEDPVREGDGSALLALFAMHDGPVRLTGPVLVLSPCPDGPSWLRPIRRWNVMTAWGRRNAELVSETRRLAKAGLLRRTERGRWWDGASLYEATGLGRDVAVRNAEALVAGKLNEEA